MDPSNTAPSTRRLSVVGAAPDRVVEGIVFGTCCALALAPLWITKYLPMADLAQHAAQISIWMNLDDPGFGFADQFEINWFSPYLLGYLLARAVASVAGVLVALKVVVSLSVIALPLSMRLLLARTGGERSWALLGVPIAFGASFYWGLFNYLVAVPVGIVFVAEAWRFAAAPTRRGGVLLAIFGTLLFFAHALVFGASVLAAGCLVAFRAPAPRALLVRALPLVPPLVIALAWMALTRSRESQASQPLVWQLGLARLTDLPVQLLGCPIGGPHRANREAVFGAISMAAALAIGVGGAARELYRWAPVFVVALLYGFAPRAAFGSSLVNERFVIFIVPFALVALVPTTSIRRLRIGRALLALVMLGWTLLLAQRFRAFAEEAAGFDAAMARVPRNRCVYGLVFDPTSGAAPGFPYLHFPAWYQAEKGGVLGFSFASFYPVLARYRPGMAPRTEGEVITSFPLQFDPLRDGAAFEYLLVRANADLRTELPAYGYTFPEVVAHEGTWWVYHRLQGAR